MHNTDEFLLFNIHFRFGLMQFSLVLFIYAWMRMVDVLETDDLLFALFRLAAEKRTRAK